MILVAFFMPFFSQVLDAGVKERRYGFAFARRVQHPGTEEDSFVYDALEAEEAAIVSRFDHIIRNW